MLELLETPITVVHVLVCLMVVLVVLIQPGKSGGLGAALGGAGAQQIFGGRGAGNFLTKATWICGSVFFFTSVTLAYLSSSTGDSLEELGAEVEETVQPAPEATPASETTTESEPAAPEQPASGASTDSEPASNSDGAGDPAVPTPNE